MFGSEDVTNGLSLCELGKDVDITIDVVPVFINTFCIEAMPWRIRPWGWCQRILMLMVNEQSAMPLDPTDNRKLFWDPKCLGCLIPSFQTMGGLFPA